jgi:cobalt-zinc-cadmium efflux system protein
MNVRGYKQVAGLDAPGRLHVAHIRRPLAGAAALNTLIFAGEAWAGARANSLSLMMDAVHNFSDELALICLVLAYSVTARASRSFQRGANLLNGLGLVLISAAVSWQAIERLVHPRPVSGWLPIAVGIFGVVGNWGVARLLRPWAPHSATIRLAYLHNLGDVYVSLAPVVAGGLVLLTRRPVFDALVALGIGVWLMGTTLWELRRLGTELIWPEEAVCPHAEHAST